MQNLTPRELDVLKLVMYSNQEIAVHLRLSESRVKGIWHGIFRALGIDGEGPKRIKAIMKALRCNIITFSEIEPAPRRK